MDSERLDARATRLDDGIVAVLLLAGFVFNFVWLVPAVAAIAALGAVFGLRGAPLVRAYHYLVAPNLSAPTTLVHPGEWRFAVAIEAVVLVVAALILFTELAVIGWLLALAVAVVGALDATTGISVGAWAHRRWGRNR